MDRIEGKITGGGELALAEGLDCVKAAVLLLDDNLHVVFANRAYLQFYNLDVEICRPGANFVDIVWILVDSGEYGVGEIGELVESRLAPVRARQEISRVRVRPNGQVLSTQGVPLPSGGYIYTVTDVTAEHHAAEHAKTVHKATVIALADLAEYRDTETGDHVIRVSRLIYEIAREMRRRGTLATDNPEAFCAEVGIASILHDVGKVAIPDQILHKPGFLEPVERVAMQQHAALGARVLAKAASMASDSGYLRLGVEIARHHHERYDGAGYPDQLAGADIPLSARITAVADVYDALISERPYKAAWTEEKAIGFVREQAGAHFDPDVADAFEAVMAERSKTPLIQWTPAMSVGNEVLDRDHKMLVGLINHLALDSNRDDRTVLELVLDELVGYAAAHFSREEGYLEVMGYPHLAAHRAIHRRLTGELKTIRARFVDGTHAIGDEIREFLANWLTRHIMDEDMRYARHAERGPEGGQ
ncbi:MAG: bacteriohemerythrin [Rhodospirillaceae bacterium]|nr:bacteriohemerythrin [Rhodospirillales bacterium]